MWEEMYVCAKNEQIDKSFRELRTLCLLLQLTIFATSMHLILHADSDQLG